MVNTLSICACWLATLPPVLLMATHMICVSKNSYAYEMCKRNIIFQKKSQCTSHFSHNIIITKSNVRQCSVAMSQGLIRPNHRVWSIRLQLLNAVGNSLNPQTRGHILNLDELNTGAPSQLNWRVMSDVRLSSLYTFPSYTSVSCSELSDFLWKIDSQITPLFNKHFNWSIRGRTNMNELSQSFASPPYTVLHWRHISGTHKPK